MSGAFPSNKTISVVMLSNAMNHHQFPFCDGMAQQEGIEFHFVATKPIAQERLAIGFRDLNTSRDYIVRAYESDEAKRQAMQLATESDFVIYGSAPFDYIKNRLRNKKWTFLYSERLFKETRGGDFLNLKTILACFLRYGFSSHRRLRLLCSSAYSSRDFRWFRFQKNQTYRWGYFPPQSDLTWEELKSKKEPLSLCWVGRMIHWKHPELAVETAGRLKDAGVDFKMTIAGDGPMLESMKEKVEALSLGDRIVFLGAVDNEIVRKTMETSSILMTTSDHNEGWGAMVNEGMASGCAVVASHAMGSAPFLIEHGESGLLFQSGNADDLFDRVRGLLENEEACQAMGQKAFETVSTEWNGSRAAEKLSEVFRRLLSGEENFAFSDGVCSHTEYLKNDWFKQEGMKP